VSPVNLPLFAVCSTAFGNQQSISDREPVPPCVTAASPLRAARFVCLRLQPAAYGPACLVDRGSDDDGPLAQARVNFYYTDTYAPTCSPLEPGPEYQRPDIPAERPLPVFASSHGTAPIAFDYPRRPRVWLRRLSCRQIPRPASRRHHLRGRSPILPRTTRPAALACHPAPRPCLSGATLLRRSGDAAHSASKTFRAIWSAPGISERSTGQGGRAR
jgi:hypothetical protein